MRRLWNRSTADLWPVLFFLTLSLGVAASAGTIDPGTPDSKYIAFGKKFSMVAKITAPTTITKKISVDGTPAAEETIKTTLHGSAVVIQAHWALTAAHVLVEATGLPTLHLENGKKHSIQTVILHRDFLKQDKPAFGRDDIALCYSPTDFGLEFYPPLYTERDEIGKPVTMAGYGATGTFLTGCIKVDGEKRGGQNVIAATREHALFCVPRRTQKFPLEFCIAPGDSGGGLFIGNSLAGICSFLAAPVNEKPDGTYGDEAGFTRISAYVPWIYDAIEVHDQLRAELEALP